MNLDHLIQTIFELLDEVICADYDQFTLIRLADGCECHSRLYRLGKHLFERVVVIRAIFLTFSQIEPLLTAS